ncbi:MAG: hypothetical protein JNM76_17455 [Betaproteobacteria bacterium]|nr:hypothetical protein [Betaproteobacteria bacterium]
MLADMFKSALVFFADPNTEMWMKGLVALMLLLLTGFAWMLLRRLVPALGKPLRWYRERQAWQAVAAREGWVTAVTRKFSGNREGQPWRMRAHLQDAWITEEEDSPPPTQAQWQMKDGAWSGRVLIVPRALDEAAQARATAGSGAADAANLALAAAGIVGVLAGQSWGSAALGWASGSTEDAATANQLAAVPVGSAAFQEGYLVRSDSPDLVKNMITPEAESMLAALRDGADPANAFMVEMHHSKFSMRQLGDFSDAERAAQFCKLGLALTRDITV